MKLKKIKAYAIMPAFPNSKELETYPFLTEGRQYMIYLTKEDAEKANRNMDEQIKRVEIVIK